MFLKLEFGNSIKKTRFRPELRDLRALTAYCSTISKIPESSIDIKLKEANKPLKDLTQQELSKIYTEMETNSSHFLWVVACEKGSNPPASTDFVNFSIDDSTLNITHESVNKIAAPAQENPPAVNKSEEPNKADPPQKKVEDGTASVKQQLKNLWADAKPEPSIEFKRKKEETPIVEEIKQVSEEKKKPIDEEKRKRKEMKELQTRLIMEKIRKLEERLSGVENSQLDISIRHDPILEKKEEPAHANAGKGNCVSCKNAIKGSVYLCCFCEGFLKCSKCGVTEHEHPQIVLPLLPSSKEYLEILLQNFKAAFNVDIHALKRQEEKKAEVEKKEVSSPKPEEKKNDDFETRLEMVRFMSGGSMSEEKMRAFVTEFIKFAMEDFMVIAHNEIAK